MNVGDVVVLKSGSLKMTIIELDDGWATCVWFKPGDPESHRGTYPVAALTLQR